jgi:tetratricopeptide (TPR) repeat protein
VTAELKPVIRDNPLREQFYALLMLALYRCGQQSEALAVYQQARQLLVAELGVEPGTALRKLHQQILAAGPALNAPEPTIPGPARPRELPAPPPHFIGRTAELAALTSLLDEAPGTLLISAIAGMAGVGKTALALHWAHELAHRFPDGQLYVNLHGFDPSGVPAPPSEAIRGFLELYQQLDDKVGQALVNQNLSVVTEHQGHYRTALGHAEQALQLFQATGHQAGLGPALNSVGWCHIQLGDFQQARTFCREAIAANHEAGNLNNEAAAWDSLGEAEALTHLGDNCQAVGDLTEAREAWQQALGILDDLRHPNADGVRARLSSGQLSDVAKR